MLSDQKSLSCLGALLSSDSKMSELMVKKSCSDAKTASMRTLPCHLTQLQHSAWDAGIPSSQPTPWETCKLSQILWLLRSCSSQPRCEWLNQAFRYSGLVLVKACYSILYWETGVLHLGATLLVVPSFSSPPGHHDSIPPPAAWLLEVTYGLAGLALSVASIGETSAANRELFPLAKTGDTRGELS